MEFFTEELPQLSHDRMVFVEIVCTDESIIDSTIRCVNGSILCVAVWGLGNLHALSGAPWPVSLARLPE